MKKLLSFFLCAAILMSSGVISFSASAQVGDIMVEEIESNNSMISANVVSNDNTVFGSLIENDVDYFKFTLNRPSRVFVMVFADYNTLNAKICDSNDSVMLFDTSGTYEDSVGSYSYTLDSNIAAGTYYIVLSDVSVNEYLFYIYIETTTKHVHEYKEIIPEFNDETKHYYKCTCGVFPGKTHYGGTATCTQKAICTECNTEYGEYVAHKGGTATCTQKAICAECNTEYGKYAAHKGGTATCIQKAICAVCNKEYGEFAKHKGGNGNNYRKSNMRGLWRTIWRIKHQVFTYIYIAGIL